MIPGNLNPSLPCAPKRALFSSPLHAVRQGLRYEDRLGLLTVLLKGFFAPLMLLSLFDFSGQHGCEWCLSRQSCFCDSRRTILGAFNSRGFWFFFQLILFLDVVFFTVGYLVELPALKNEIRSVDPTWLGWAVAVICYPPFNGITTKILGWNLH